MKPIESVRWTKGKSHKKHYYTTKDIARVAGRAVGTIRNDSAAGKIDLDSLESVIEYCKEINTDHIRDMV